MNNGRETCIRALLLCGALALVVTPAEATNGLKLTAYGARAAGRGGVDYAFADDAIGMATNPAGMVFVYGNRLDQNWALINPIVRWENNQDESDDEDDLFFPVPAFSFGAFIDPAKDWEIAPIFDLGSWGLFDDDEEDLEVEQLPGEASDLDAFEPDDGTGSRVYGSRWRIGLGVFPVTGGKIQFKDLKIPVDPTDPNSGLLYDRPIDWETDVLTLAITPALAFRITEHLSVGLNIQAIYSKFELDGGIAQPLKILSDDFEFPAIALNFSGSGQMFTYADLDDAFTWGISSRLGLMFNTKYFSAGIMYQDRSYMADYLGKGRINAKDEVARLTSGLGGASALQLINAAIGDQNGDGVLDENDFSGTYDLRIQDFNYPRMFGLGFAIRPHRRFSIGVDYTYIHWSEVMRVFKVRLTNGTNGNLNLMTGNTIHVRVPLNWDNQHVIALGATVLAYEGEELVEGVPSWALVLRAGYNYGNNPVPDDTTLPQQPTISEHHVSAGFTVHWGPLVEFNFAWEWALPTKVTTPDDHEADFSLGNSEQELQIHFLHFGLGINF